MKKFLALILSAVLALSFTACSNLKKKNNIEAENALVLMENVWNSYNENEKFFIFGGDSDNMVSDGPGKVSANNTDFLDSSFAISASAANMIDDAASIIHAMLANNFTAVAVHISDSSEIKPFTEDLKKSLEKRQWLCGIPDKMYIASIGNFVISVFGNDEMVNDFSDKLLKVCPNTDILVDQPVL